MAKSSGCCVIVDTNSTVIDRVVDRQYCYSGVVVVDILYEIVLVDVIWKVAVSVEKGKRENGRKASTESEESGDAARSMGVLRTDDTVECLHRVGAK